LGHRACARSRWSTTPDDDAGGGAQALRREHDRRRADAGRHLHLPVRAGQGRRRRARQLEKDTGLDIPIHVDGASGGFLAPFCAPDLEWDFRIPRVKSINTSGHKFGLSPLGVGWVIWREAADLPEDLVFWVNYLGGNMRDLALNFSRPGGQIVCQYYNFLRLGQGRLPQDPHACYETAQYLAEEIEKMGPFEIIYDGEMDAGIPPCAGRSRTASTRASASTTWPTDCAAAAGRCPPIRCRPTPGLVDPADPGAARRQPRLGRCCSRT
jgi:hypothetical protein